MARAPKTNKKLKAPSAVKTVKAKTAASKKPSLTAKITTAKTVIPAKPSTAPFAGLASTQTHAPSSCPCHAPIDATCYGRWLKCHLMALGCQRQTWGVAVIVFAMMLSLGSLLFNIPMTPRPLLLTLTNHAVTALAFALVFRLAYTGCGGLIEGLKLGTLLFMPLASVLVFLPLVSIPDFIPLVATGLVLQALATGLFCLLIGAASGLLSAWYLKPTGLGCCSTTRA